jgi:CheY-like chemotaxis protein
MTSILLIDDEREWLELIRRALPEYDVDQAESYDDALALLGGGAMYDVAIVDLNLLGIGSDGLGGALLEIMRDRYPSIRRIALTGRRLTSVRTVFDRFDVDDLLLKDKTINLAVVREVVEVALGRTNNDVPRELRAMKSEMLTSVRSWKEDILLGLDQRSRTLRNDVSDAAREGKRAEDSAKELEALEAMSRNLETECSQLTKFVSGIRTDEEVMSAAQEFERLKSIFSS